MVNYKEGRIYKIVSAHSDKYYIGSTTQTLCKRMEVHRSKYKGYLKGQGPYVTSFELLKLGECHIYLIEKCSCDSKEELCKREGELIREFKNELVNKKIEGRTMAEYRIDNKDNIKEMNKQYRINNQDKIKDKIKQYRIDNQDNIKHTMKQYYIDNQEKIKEMHKQYFIDNQDKIKETRGEKIICECGSEISRGNRSQHLKTKKHLKK